ncbi:MAG TPA: LD-carboxypeptidase [Vicinamibacteria bacterium]|nr:LD-carboxypeptidase [Vicinamibacteria bacterium]
MGEAGRRHRTGDRRQGDRRRGTPRRVFLGLGLASAAALLAPLSSSARPRRGPAPPSPPLPPVKPPRLEPGDVVGLINPAAIPPRPDDLDVITGRLRALDLVPRAAGHALDPSASDEQRALDINEMFADPAVKALLPLRGGWGSARVLPFVDYELARRHPKVVIGYSDIVALLLALHARSGLVTFHGPVGVSGWDPFTVRCLREVLFEGRAALLANPGAEDGKAAPIETLHPGRASGPLAGGNLTVMSSLIGSQYLSYEDSILFIEEVQEPVSEVDRMLTQLEQAGILARARGFVFGQCTGCMQAGLDPSLTLARILEERIRPLGIPAWSGAAIGHIERQFVLPLGVPAEIDAAAGTIRLLEPAVI